METDSEFQQLKDRILSLQPDLEAVLNPTEVMDYVPSLSDTVREQIRQLVQSNRRAACSRLITEVVKSSSSINQFVVALERQGYESSYEAIFEPNRLREMLEEPATDDANGQPCLLAKDYCEFIVKHLKGELVSRIIPSHILPSLLSSGCINDEDAECVSLMEQTLGPSEACREMFAKLPRKKAKWALTFIQVLKEEYNYLLRKMDPNEEYEVDGHVAESKKKMSDQGGSNLESCLPSSGNSKSEAECPKDDFMDVDDVDDDVDESLLEFSDEEKQDEELSEKNVVSDSKCPDLSLHNYQRELAEVGLEGTNDIICAGTGSGKTRVAIYIIKRHLEAAAQDERKVAFFARTVPLVGQQGKVLKKYLPHLEMLSLTGDSGDENKCLPLLLPQNNIVVLTPQVLENHLREGTITSLSVFSLLVFDECQHTKKGEPYNSIMKRYLKLKFEQKQQRLPKILGLTASIGVAKATTCKEAVESVLTVCANMDVTHISTVEKFKEEYEEIVPVPETHSEILHERIHDPVKNAINQEMVKVEEMLEESEVMIDNKQFQKLILKIPTKDRASQEYHQWSVLLQKSLQESLSCESPPYREALTCNNLLKSLNRALEVNELLRPQDVLSFLFNDVKLPQGDKQTDMDKQLNQLCLDLRKKLLKIRRSADSKNPNLEKILNILKQHFDRRDELRFIVFVRTRAAAMAMSDFLRDSEYKCSHFTGAGPKEEEGGMTQIDQDRIILQLRNGDLDGIVSTSVGEEGIDIPDCNLILRYDHVGNEISTVQTKGRSRKRGGKSFLLAKRKIFQRETINIERAKLMRDAVRHFKAMPLEEKMAKVQEIQKKVLGQERMKEMILQDKISKKKKAAFELRCGRCGKQAVEGDYIRCINGQHHVITDPQFIHRMDAEPASKVKKFDDITIDSKMKCKKCSFYWGEMLIYQTVHFPVIKITSFVVIDCSKKTPPKQYKKWIDVPFTVSVLTDEDCHQQAGN